MPQYISYRQTTDGRNTVA